MNAGHRGGRSGGNAANGRRPDTEPGVCFLTFAFAAMLCSGCDAPEKAAPDSRDTGMPAAVVIAGRVADEALTEISGLARSGHDPRRLWVHNDSGDGAVLHAIDVEGRSRGRLALDDADNVDWEDLAAFVHEGRPYLLVADTGDNEGRREILTLYAVAEPELPDGATVTATPAWRVDFRYPDGPHDAEAVAVDAPAGAIYVLTKRDVPPVLYRLPLVPPGAEPVTATRVRTLNALPRPRYTDLEVARVTNHWHWQPTAMDLAPDGSFAVVLTYGSVYYFRRQPGQELGEALSGRPLGFGLRRLRNAEALAVAPDGHSLYVGVEARRAPLLRIEF